MAKYGFTRNRGVRATTRCRTTSEESVCIDLFLIWRYSLEATTILSDLVMNLLQSSSIVIIDLYESPVFGCAVVYYLV